MKAKISIYRASVVGLLIGSDMASARLRRSSAARRAGKSAGAAACVVPSASDHQGSMRAPASILRSHATMPIAVKQQTP
jgi:hypothetical protein